MPQTAARPRRGLYLHIPFCARKCHYCDFVITVKKSPEMRERFFASLSREIEQASRIYGPLSFDTLYFGGGTPSLLSEEEISRIAQRLFREFRFNEGFEFTIEVNPGDADASKIKRYRLLGANRISVGAQTFNNALLKGSGRLHSAGDTIQTVRLLREAGFDNLSLDFILNLPGQTLEDVSDSMNRAVALGAGQAVLYDLDVHEKTLFGSWRRRGMLTSADEEGQWSMWKAADNILSRAGYIPYELSSYAKPGYAAQHNLIYWKNEEYLGLGPGAFSYMDGVRYQYALDVEGYLSKCEAGDWTRDSEDFLSPEEIEIETFITGLRLREGVDLSRFPLTGDRFRAGAEKLAGEGFLFLSDERVSFTQKGRSVADRIFLELLPTREAGGIV